MNRAVKFYYFTYVFIFSFHMFLETLFILSGYRCCVFDDTAANMTTGPSSTTTPMPISTTFDVASFLGGILLGAAVVAIGLVAWRCYLHRRQRDVPYSAMAE